MAAGVGIEPTTYGLTVRRSTAELPGIIKAFREPQLRNNTLEFLSMSLQPLAHRPSAAATSGYHLPDMSTKAHHSLFLFLLC